MSDQAPPRVFKYVHLTANTVIAGEPVKGGIKLGMIIDLSDPHEVTIQHMGGPCDEYLLNFTAEFFAEEIDQWTSTIWPALLQEGCVTKTQELKLRSHKLRNKGWTGQPLNRTFDIPKKGD